MDKSKLPLPPSAGSTPPATPSPAAAAETAGQKSPRKPKVAKPSTPSASIKQSPPSAQPAHRFHTVIRLDTSPTDWRSKGPLLPFDNKSLQPASSFWQVVQVISLITLARLAIIYLTGNY